MSHASYVPQALTILSLDNPSDEEFRTTTIYELYEEICRKNGSEALSLCRLRDPLIPIDEGGRKIPIPIPALTPLRWL
jgi:hypothetical protein